MGTDAAAIYLFMPSPSLSTRLCPLRTKSVVPRPFFSSTSASIRRHVIQFKISKSWRFTPWSCTSPYLDAEPSQQLGILMEVDGVLADLYRLGNCEAFNVAFQKLGLDCANWTEPIYADLKRKTAGDEERMLILFFNRIGWPSSLPTTEKEAFMKRIMREKRKALQDFAISSDLALRPGVEKKMTPKFLGNSGRVLCRCGLPSLLLTSRQPHSYRLQFYGCPRWVDGLNVCKFFSFIDEAIQEGLPLVLLTAYSKNGDEVCRSIIEKLGHDRISEVKVVGKEEVQQSYYGQLVLGKGVSSSLDEQLAKEAKKAVMIVSMEKQRVAQEVASILKLNVDIDRSSIESTDLVVATLRAGAEYIGLPVQDCVLIAGSQSGLVGAERIGLSSVVIRSSSTARAEFDKAKSVMDGFGGADLTVSKLLNKRFTDPR